MFKCLKGLKRVTPGERQAGPPRRSHWCGLGGSFCLRCWAFREAFAHFQDFKRFRGFKGFKRLRAGKRQAWTAHKKPLMWPWGACWLRDQACQENVEAFEGFEACNAWRTAGWTAQKKPLTWPWGSFCLRGWAFREAFAHFQDFKRFRGFKGFKRLRAGKRQAWTAHKKPLMWPWGARWLRD